jgi:hypothetical protein
LIGNSIKDKELLVQWLSEVLSQEDSPFSEGIKSARQREIRERDVEILLNSTIPFTEADFGISSNGQDQAQVEKIREGLNSLGKKTLWYQDPVSRQAQFETKEGEDLKRLDDFMKALVRQNKMILVISKSYLEGGESRFDECDEQEKKRLRDACLVNRYCAFELADTMLSLLEGRRSPKDITVIIKPSEDFSTTKVYEKWMIQLLQNMGEYYRTEYARKVRNKADKPFRNYIKLFERFERAAEPDCFNMFKKHFGQEAAPLRLSSDLAEIPEQIIKEFGNDSGK